PTLRWSGRKTDKLRSVDRKPQLHSARIPAGIVAAASSSGSRRLRTDEPSRRLASRAAPNCDELDEPATKTECCALNGATSIRRNSPRAELPEPVARAAGVPRS